MKACIGFLAGGLYLFLALSCGAGTQKTLGGVWRVTRQACDMVIAVDEAGKVTVQEVQPDGRVVNIPAERVNVGVAGE